MKSWPVTVKTVWYLKTGRSNGQNRQISWDWAILILLVSSTLKRDKQKCARSFKKKQDEQDLTVRRSNDDRPPVPAIQVLPNDLAYPVYSRELQWLIIPLCLTYHIIIADNIRMNYNAIMTNNTLITYNPLRVSILNYSPSIPTWLTKFSRLTTAAWLTILSNLTYLQQQHGIQ